MISDTLTMSEKDSFLDAWDREHKTTIRVLKAYPTGKDNLKPAEKCRTAAELAGVFVGEQSGIIDGVLKGQIDWNSFQKPPATVQESTKKLESEYERTAKGVRAMSESDWNADIDWPVAPKQMGKMRRGDVLWMAVNDMIHHRGQFSVYLRMAGGKVPSIYGPTADEPWM